MLSEKFVRPLPRSVGSDLLSAGSLFRRPLRKTLSLALKRDVIGVSSRLSDDGLALFGSLLKKTPNLFLKKTLHLL